MKKYLLLAALVVGASLTYSADKAKLGQETLDDIAKHRIIAKAHEAAAQCLEAGKSDEECEGKLQAACKGVAIGKFCGMKH